MNRRSLGALIVLNAVLLAALAVLTFSPPQATAQGFGARSDYLMIPGFAQGRSNQEAVYIFELRSSKMVALFFNAARSEIEYIAARDIAGDVQAGPRGR
jgi:hypothetical protein